MVLCLIGRLRFRKQLSFDKHLSKLLYRWLLERGTSRWFGARFLSNIHKSLWKTSNWDAFLILSFYFYLKGQPNRLLHVQISSPSGPPFNFLPKNLTANISGWGQLQGVKRVEIPQGQESGPNFECGGVSFWRRLCLDRGHCHRCHVLVWCGVVWCDGVSFWRRLRLDLTGDTGGTLDGHWGRCHGGIRRRMTDGGETDKWADKSQLVREMLRDGLVATVEENNRTQMGKQFPNKTYFLTMMTLNLSLRLQ